MNKQLIDIKNLNASNSFGVCGAGSVSIWYPLAGSVISYIQCVDITDHNFAELWFSQKTISKSNFINNSGMIRAFWVYTTATLTLQDCTLINTPALIVAGGGNLIAINCQSDMSYNGYKFLSLNNKNEFIVVVSNYKIQKCITAPNNIACIYFQPGYCLIFIILSLN